jgi:hypothetical protein
VVDIWTGEIALIATTPQEGMSEGDAVDRRACSMAAARATADPS